MVSHQSRHKIACFPDSKIIICVRHIEQNVERCLTDNDSSLKLGNKIVSDLFDEEDGWINQPYGVLVNLHETCEDWDNYCEIKNGLHKKVTFSNWFRKKQEERFIETAFFKWKNWSAESTQKQPSRTISTSCI